MRASVAFRSAGASGAWAAAEADTTQAATSVQPFSFILEGVARVLLRRVLRAAGRRSRPFIVESRPMFTQTLVPLGSLWTTVLVAFVPLVVLLALLAGFRITAWLATLVAGAITAAIGIWIWHAPPALMARAYLY